MREGDRVLVIGGTYADFSGIVVRAAAGDRNRVTVRLTLFEEVLVVDLDSVDLSRV
jgi:transcription antitermination factor NusG